MGNTSHRGLSAGQSSGTGTESTRGVPTAPAQSRAHRMAFLTDSPAGLACLLVAYMLLACVLTAACVCLGIAAAAWACSEPWTAVAIGAVVLVACVLAGPVAVHGRDLGVVEDK